MHKPYTYYLFWNDLNVGYIGVRTANQVAAEDDLWDVYKTSSKYVHKFADENGEPAVKLFWEHNTKEDATTNEKELFDRLGADVRKKYMLNENFNGVPRNTGNPGPCSEEKKLKISAAQKGKSRWTKEQRLQMSIDRKGRVPWNKSANAHKQEVAKAQERKWFIGTCNKEHGETELSAATGHCRLCKNAKYTKVEQHKARKPRSKETRKRISFAHMGKVCSEEHKQAMKDGWAKRKARLEANNV